MTLKLKFILTFIVLFEISGCFRFDPDNLDNISSIDCSSSSSKVIDSKSAICFALSVEGVREKIERADSSDVNFYWDIKSKKIKDKWFVNIYSRGVLPSYSCDIRFNFRGEKLGSRKFFSVCGYNK